MAFHSTNEWNATLYDEKIDFVSKLGKGVLELLDPQPGEKILDLGCGTGDLTYEIAAAGAIPTGIDYAASMIEKARQKYPDISFFVENALQFRTEETFDAVFSNAVLHWISQPEKAVENVWYSLRPGGRFVAEFGGKGNVQSIVRAIAEVLEMDNLDVSGRNPWYYPSIGEYSLLLEQQGFRVIYAVHFDRPTPLPGGENGLDHWLDMFSDDFFSGVSPSEKKEMYGKIKQRLTGELYKEKQWVADYKRIRVLAVKEG
jgi:trans-aconitate methyltransferase